MHLASAGSMNSACICEPKRQRTAALQDAGAATHAPERAKRLGVRLSSAAFGFAAKPEPLPYRLKINLTSYWNERKAHETGVVAISSGYTLGFWRSREERGQAQFL